jgi:hypothetical protein
VAFVDGDETVRPHDDDATAVMPPIVRPQQPVLVTADNATGLAVHASPSSALLVLMGAVFAAWAANRIRSPRHHQRPQACLSHVDSADRNRARHRPHRSANPGTTGKENEHGNGNDNGKGKGGKG